VTEEGNKRGDVEIVSVRLQRGLLKNKEFSPIESYELS
jgi:hypothetical protein